MKRIILPLLLILSVQSFAQGIYIRAGSGYGLPAATAILGENRLIRQEYDATGGLSYESTSEIVRGSYGAGPVFDASIGYKFNENFIFELGLQYLAGRKYETSYRNYYIDIGMSTMSENVVTSYSRGLYFNPSFVFSAGFGKQAPYARFGILAASPKIIQREESYDDGDGITTSDITWEYSGGIAIGFQTAVGVNWKITERLDIYTESSFLSMTYYARKGTMTENIYNGTDVLDQLIVAAREIEYRKKVDYIPQPDPDSPTQEVRFASPFSYVSARVGIRFDIFNFDKD